MSVRVKMRKSSASEAGPLIAGQEYTLSEERVLELRVGRAVELLDGVTFEELERRVAEGAPPAPEGTGAPLETTEGAGPAETADETPSGDASAPPPAEVSGAKAAKKPTKAEEKAAAKAKADAEAAAAMAEAEKTDAQKAGGQ